MMMHKDAQWIKMQEKGLLNFSGPGEVQKMLRQKLALEVENKKWHESTRRASGININKTTCGKIAYESNENHRKSQNLQK